MKKLLTKSITVLLVSTSFIACQKETEPVPQSNETATGVTSGPGPMEFTQRGPNGAVVIYSNWIPKTQADWTGFGTNEITTLLIAPSLSTDIMNMGVVLVYGEGGGVVRILPNVYFDASNMFTADFSFVKQKITVKVRFSDIITEVGDVRYRYVLIPGTSPGGRIMSAPVDYTDYNAVCNYFSIPK